MRPSPLFPVTGLNNRFSGIASFNGFIAFLREVSILQYYANIIDFSSSHPHQWRHAITSSLLPSSPTAWTIDVDEDFWYRLLASHPLLRWLYITVV